MKAFDSVKDWKNNQFKKESKKMMPAPRELPKEYVKSQNFTSTAEIMTAMKEIFGDVVQTVMEAELDKELERERCQRAKASNTAQNYRNGYSRKTVKTQLGEVNIKVPRDRKGTFLWTPSTTNETLEEAEENLLQFWEKWRRQYPSCVKSREENWDVLSTFYEYPPEVRKIIYTANMIEGLNRQFQQITKNKHSFTNDNSLRRMLYLASRRNVKH